MTTMHPKKWTEEKIKAGFETFIAEHGHLPKSSEIDMYQHLPSSRYIQKRFGGLQAIREVLGYTDTHFGKGAYRSSIATHANAQSKEVLAEVSTRLHTLFAPEAIQSEYLFYQKYRVNFYIQTEKGNMGIDVFHADSMRTLQSNINIKMKKYHHFTDQLYLVVTDDTYTQRVLNEYSKNKKLPFPDTVSLLTLPTLYRILKKEYSASL